MLKPLTALGLALALSLCLAGAALADSGPPLSVALPRDMNVHVVTIASLTGFKLDSPDAGAVKLGAFGGGIGGGIDFWASKPYTVTLATAAQLVGGVNGASSSAQIAGLLGFARYYYGGVSWTTGSGGLYLVAGLDVLRLATGL